MAVLTKDAILKAEDLERKLVTVKEWGGDVYVRSMTAAERDDWEAGLMASKTEDAKSNLRNLRARLTVICVVDEAGNRLFSDADAEALGQKSARAVDRIFSAAARLNALSSRDVEDLAGN